MMIDVQERFLLSMTGNLGYEHRPYLARLMGRPSRYDNSPARLVAAVDVVEVRMSRHFVMCAVYVLAILLAFDIPFPMNWIQGGLCGFLLPFRLYLAFRTRAALRDDGSRIYNEPAVFDEEECEARGRADRAAGVHQIDCPYVAGLPVYAWERGYHE